jgi:hypothetical protein
MVGTKSLSTFVSYFAYFSYLLIETVSGQKYVSKVCLYKPTGSIVASVCNVINHLGIVRK